MGKIDNMLILLIKRKVVILIIPFSKELINNSKE